MRIICLFLLFSIATQFSYAQADTNKYRINLPGYWKPGNKAWRILNDKLPLVCEELKNKDLCGDNCNAMYSVDFELTEPEVFDYYAEKYGGNMYEIVALYYFQCNLYVKNRKGEVVTRIILVDSNEVYKHSERIQFNEFPVPPPPLKTYLQRRPGNTRVLVYAPSSVAGSVGSERLSNSVFSSNGNNNSQSPYHYINNNKEKLRPREAELYSIIDKKIAALDD